MSRFKTGDMAIVARPESSSDTHQQLIGKVTEIDANGNYGSVRLCVADGHEENYWSRKLDLVISKEDKSMGRRTFRQLKETPDVKKGALWQEDCEDGTQPYSLITPEHDKSDNGVISYHKRSLVEDQPKWFVEVFPIIPAYMTAEEKTAYEAFVKKQKAKKGKK